MQGRLEGLQSAAEGGFKAMYAMEQFLADSDVPQGLLHLLKLRVSQINGCGFCVDMHARDAAADGESAERINGVAAFREMPYFTDAERGALELAEAATRIADNPHGVPDDVWNAARKHYDDAQLGALIMAVAAINAWNRINVTNRTVAGTFAR
ncbi:alkylhydroperoxidase AhpD family core domain-containing protein [Prauserella aidingensis]|uniref:carboxymuconolactone decarboxylase family protein n=1 Tax=Prauserella aidingensis TaxID=387890 RepID=UPI0035566EA8|nr:alkylhydroperoxidase AhpD family core domain-containing protein [Prauserella aidingensis]MCP2255627.1 alkylhydroperoxidase AhpD family core domain-containing protein [Prauserella aidingensis]